MSMPETADPSCFTCLTSWEYETAGSLCIQRFSRCQASLYFSYFARVLCGVRRMSDCSLVDLIGRMYQVSVGIT
jgi:hypothetical protein